MKKANITISFEQEKLRALQFYAGKKDISLQDELDDALQKLYEKCVPAQTREYIESTAEDERAQPRQRPSRPTSVSGAHMPGNTENPSGGGANA